MCDPVTVSDFEADAEVFEEAEDMTVRTSGHNKKFWIRSAYC